MGYILDCKQISDNERFELKQEIEAKGIKAKLVTIQVGEYSASTVYVRNKKLACDYVGIKNEVMRFEDKISTETLLDIIKLLNGDNSVTGILVQLPLPKHIDEELIINAIHPDKDVDGFSHHHVAELFKFGTSKVLPCTPTGIMTLLDSQNVDLVGKNVCIIGRSNIVGKPMAHMLLNRGCTVTVCHSKTKNLQEHTRRADILIVAVGIPKFIANDEVIKKGAIIIDVGINRDENGKLCGDCDTEALLEQCEWITPVPRGVGVMTVTELIKNVIKLS